MANFLALMLATVKSPSTNFLTHEPASAAFNHALLFSAEAFLSHVYLAFGAGPLMADFCTLMDPAVN